jgi:hypothetical protein
MSYIAYIGLDDTDILGGPIGTGRVARDMAEYLEKLGSGHTIGVIRYQLLVDPRVHYTSHNSSKCVEFEAEVPLPELHRRCADYIKQNFQVGSDPGLCTCAEEQVTRELVEYGESAQREFITKEQAISLALKSGILLSELGGTGEGIIGALASTGLRGSGSGSGGRYVQLRGIRNLKGLITVDSVLNNTAITAVIDEEGRPVGSDEIIDSHDWIKPNVVDGKPVLRIHLRSNESSGMIWETIEQKHEKKGEEKEAIP